MIELSARAREAAAASGDPLWLYTSSDPEAVAWRREQAQVDADIEGLARDPEVDAFVMELEAAGLDVEEQIARIGEYFRERSRKLPAAE